ncbi:MAG: L-histidine N(alpha)-methyltransferase [Leptospiraceae bacterium]|nr:L-histidine N(alpha)-methyltransferase [Leptospiraceae bacterium]
MSTDINIESFKKDVLEGLSGFPKYLPSKYFYDEKGDHIFLEIMEQDEYYLSRSETEILKTYSTDILNHLDLNFGIHLIEPGSGNGIKTAIFMEELLKLSPESVFNPIDISPNVLSLLLANFKKLLPDARVEPIVTDYDHIYSHLPHDNKKKLMLFLGSNLGNYNYSLGLKLLKTFTDCLSSNDYFLIGLDLVKEPSIILSAYNDANGTTANFNFNLLERMNRELKTDFQKDGFFHYPIYNPILQQAESYLISNRRQTISFQDSNEKIELDKWESIHTEISRKFTLREIEEMANLSGMEVIKNYFDSREYFCCSLWKKK